MGRHPDRFDSVRGYNSVMRFHMLAPALLIAVVSLAACKPTPPAAASSAGVTQPAAEPVSVAAASSAHAGEGTPSGKSFTGTIAETMNSGGYTYARLQSGKDETWIAAPQFDAKVGEPVSVSLNMAMSDFQSKTLNRTFPTLYFVEEVARNGQPLSPRPAAAMMNSQDASAKAAPVEKIAPPPGGMSVADVFAKKADLSGKTVVVRGKVVKFNAGILNRNWLHLQDGSGSAAAKNNDLTITTDAEAAVGDVVTVSGVLGTNKDFGFGYAYDALLEKATIAPK